MQEKTTSNCSNQAVIFDFDGLILDTETPEVEIWQKIFVRENRKLDLDYYLSTIGSNNTNEIQPRRAMALKINNGKPVEQILREFSEESDQIINQLQPLPGAVELIHGAKANGLFVAIGSSSPREWVHKHLKRLGLFNLFDTIVTFDDVSHAKPSPEIFLKVLERLDVDPQNAIVLEDSHNGVLAAHRAGIRVIAVPNTVTKSFDFSLAEEVLSSLEALNLEKYFFEQV